MDGLPAPVPSAGALTLRAAAEQVRAAAARAADLLPEHWRAPSAEAYRQQIRRLVADARRAAEQIEVAVVATQQHAAELEYVRQALLGGNPVAR